MVDINEQKEATQSDKEHFSNFKIDYKKDMQKEEESEILKHRDPNVHVFALPAMTNAKGHSTTEFTNLIFKGMMKMTVKGEHMFIYFLNPDNTIFLVSIINIDYDKFIVPTDSSRYFSVKAMNAEGVPNWYGLAFKQRNAAFDFKQALIDFKEKYEFEVNLKKQGEYKPKYDFSLQPKEVDANENKLNKFKFGGK